jgi:hypothetical protein
LFHLPISFRSLAVGSLASKLRVLTYEVTNAKKLWAELQTLLLDHINTPLRREWYESCFAKNLALAESEALALGVSCKGIIGTLKDRAPKRGDARIYIRGNFQREAYTQISNSRRFWMNVEERHRTKQSRWKLVLPPRIAASRATGMFKRLSALVSPRVVATVARTHWNGWCTKRRFQLVGPCVFHCSISCYDAVEHYPFCVVFKSLLQRVLHLPIIDTFQNFLMLDHRLWSDDRLVVTSIAHYALYTAFNAAGLLGHHATEFWLDFMERQCYFAARGHARSTRALKIAMANCHQWWI